MVGMLRLSTWEHEESSYSLFPVAWRVFGKTWNTRSETEKIADLFFRIFEIQHITDRLFAINVLHFFLWISGVCDVHKKAR